MELKVEDRLSSLSLILDKVKLKMEAIMNNKSRAVEELKKAAEEEMGKYGPYKKDIGFEDVTYFNAKKVVIQSDISEMYNETQAEIKKNINYLGTRPLWMFKKAESRPELNDTTSSIHVPTNIYDKSMKILNGVKWTENLTDQFVTNGLANHLLTWQYFCSSDGFFRIYPGMQWPRNADKVDTFDCRIRQWYIQAATSPKNIIILLDSSGSMKGLRFSIAKSTVFTILDTLSEEDYFNVLEFSDEPRYVVQCFNGTLMPASVDNIRRMQSAVEELSAKKYANFEKALKVPFELFRTESRQHTGKICNKAIMLITDGAPDNFEYIFDEYNWPNKTIRVFTFLIGKEVQDNRQARWMACANKGKFTHISTRADVQENVQKYVKVLSRPLAKGNATHKVWSSVYLDYVTQQADILAPSSKHTQLEVDYEKTFDYQGLGLVMSISMPVFDTRTKDRVGDKEEDPTRNMLGIVGADLRINELMKLLPTFELGVNGYAFAITNHGYILFHPEYKPFYTEQKGGKFKLKPRPKYNSVELSEVERPAKLNRNGNTEHPLSHFLLTVRFGEDTLSVITHFDNMRRVEKRRNFYVFIEVSDMFRLVFVVPSGYGGRWIRIDESIEATYQELDHAAGMLHDTNIDVSSWVYCKSLDGDNYQQIRFTFDYYLQMDPHFKRCEKIYAQHLMKDIATSMEYSQVWQGFNFNIRSSDIKYVKDYYKCYALSDIISKMKCFQTEHKIGHGIDIIWMGTRSGFTRSYKMNMTHEAKALWEKDNTETVKSLYYQRAVSLWSAGYKYIITGPISTTQKEFDFNNSFITMAHVEVVGDTPSMQVPAAVVAFSMKYRAFYDVFVRYTFECPQDFCTYTCNDTDHFSCYILDNNGYVLASNNPSFNGTSLFLGQHDGYLMRALIDDKIFKEIHLTDHQSICESRILSGQDNASNLIFNPLQIISKFVVSILTEIVIFLSQLTVMTWHGISEVVGLEDTVHVGDEKECGDWIPEAYVRYIYCGFVINKATGERIRANFITKMRSCEQRVTRYNLNLAALRRRKIAHSIAPCHLQCQKNHPSYQVKRLNTSNLIFVVADASCECNTNSTDVHEEEEEDEEEDEEDDAYDFELGIAHRKKTVKDKYTFSIKPEEKTYHENEQCQRLRNLSEELKRVDKTRFMNSMCFDSSKEKDTPCSQSSRTSSSLKLCIGTVLLSVLYTWTHGSSSNR